MRILKIILFFLPALMLAQNSQLTNAEVKEFKQEVSKHAENLESLSSDFTQTKHMQLMEEEAVSEGKLFYRTPDVLKWEYHSPYNYKILFKEKELHINDDGEKSVTSLRSNKMFNKLLNLISGSVNGKLLEDPENFRITYYRNGENVQAVIEPQDASIRGMFNEIILIFNGNHVVDSVKLMEENGDFTQIKFKNITLNPDLDASVFQNF